MLGNGSFMRTRRAEPGLAASKGLGLAAWIRVIFACLIAGCIAFGAGPVMAQAFKKQKQSDLGTILKPPSVDKSEPMLLQADEMIYDNENNRVTAKGNSIYLHVFDWPREGLALAGLQTAVVSARALEGNETLKVVQSAAGTADKPQTLRIPKPKTLDPIATVIKVRLAGPPKVAEINLVTKP